MRSALYLVRLEAPRQWRSLLSVGLIVALTGSVVMALALGAVRTATSFDRLVAVSDTPQAIVADYLEPLVDRAALAQAPGIAAVAALPEGSLYFQGDGIPQYEIDTIDNAAFGRTLEHGPIIRGRMFDPSAKGEAVVDEAFVQATGLDIGYTGKIRLPQGHEAATYAQNTGPIVPLTIVGVWRSPLLLLDGSGRAGTVVASPAFFRAYAPNITANGQVPLLTVVWLKPGATLGAIDSALKGQGDTGGVTVVDVPAGLQVVKRGVRVQGIALGLVAGFVGLAALGLLVLVVARVTRTGLARNRAMAAVGLTHRERGQAEVVQVAGAALVGVVLAGAMAWAASAVFPLGFARTVEPRAGALFDARLLGGVLILMLVVVIAAAASAGLALRRERREEGVARPRAFWFGGLPVTTTLAARGAIRPSRSASGGAVLLWSACAIGVIGIIGGLTVYSGIGQLSENPRIYGQAGEVHFDLPNDPSAAGVRAAVVARTSKDPQVAHVWRMESGAVTFRGGQLNLNGSLDGPQDTPASVVRGRLPETDDEISLGPGTIRAYGLAIGDRIQVVTLGGRKKSLLLVGETLLDTGNQPTFDGGGVMTAKAIDTLTPTVQGTVVTTPWVAVKLRPGVNRDAWIAAAPPVPDSAVNPYPQPTQVSNLLRIRSTPAVLAGLLGLLALVAALLALAFESRGLRGDHAVMRALGLTRAQSWRVLPQHAALVALVSVVVWTPIGVVLGRRVWRTLSDSAHFAYSEGSPLGVWAVVMAVVVGVAVLLSVGPSFSLSRFDTARTLRRE